MEEPSADETAVSSRNDCHDNKTLANGDDDQDSSVDSKRKLSGVELIVPNDLTESNSDLGISNDDRGSRELTDDASGCPEAESVKLAEENDDTEKRGVSGTGDDDLAENTCGDMTIDANCDDGNLGATTTSTNIEDTDLTGASSSSDIKTDVDETTSTDQSNAQNTDGTSSTAEPEPTSDDNAKPAENIESPQNISQDLDDSDRQKGLDETNFDGLKAVQEIPSSQVTSTDSGVIITDDVDAPDQDDEDVPIDDDVDGMDDLASDEYEDDELDEEGLMNLSLRIAQKSKDSSKLYRLVNVLDAGDDAEDYRHDEEFTPPEIEDMRRSRETQAAKKDEEKGEDEGDEESGVEEITETGAADGNKETEDTAAETVMAEKLPEVDNAETKAKNIADRPDASVSPPTSPDSIASNGYARSQIILKSPDKPKEIRTVQDFLSASPDTIKNKSGEYRRSNSWKRRTQTYGRPAPDTVTPQQDDVMEDEEENFVQTALYRAVEDGNLAAMKELLEEATNYNINTCNKGETLLHTAASGGHVEIVQYLQEKGVSVNTNDKHGDSAIYWAARQGHLEVIKYLRENGVNIDTQNKAGEAPIHVAARYGHTHILEYLCQIQANVNLQDKLGETALHTIAWHGLPSEVCSMLCEAGCKVDTRNKENETPLHCAASRGNLECVRVLLSHGASLNVQDKRLNTPLHLACRRRYVPIGLLLLHAGCSFDLNDCINETPLHPACKEGLLPVVQTMCAYGCQIDVVNKAGLSPLHLASRCGHIEVVRCLLLSGAEPDLPNKDGVSAEIMALAQGHQEVAELLAKLKPERREVCIKQLIPTNQTLSRIKVKVFGSSGVGKTTVINSLKCGYLSSFFRKARLSPASSVNGKGKGIHENGSVPRQSSLPTQLSYDVVHEGYTRGIDVQQATVQGGAGDLSLWEFSGYEPYYVMYDHFIGDPNCVHLVVFSLADPQDVQLSQMLFWLTFIKARIAPMEPIGPGGRLPWPARVILVATHADKAEVTKNAHGELESSDALILLATVKQKFEADLFLQSQVYVMDAHLAMSPDLKALRTKLGELKQQIVQYLPCSNGFLDATVSALSTWRKVLSEYPIVSWPIFIEHIRSKVNLLASEEHLKELMCQLQLLGEVIYIETENEQDLVVLSPKWLTSDVIGHLLSHDQLKTSRPTGCFTVDDFQLVCPETEARDMLVILEALELCTRCEVDGEVEYEFPCLNFVEMIPGLWEKDDSRIVDPVYGGVRIHCPRGMNNQLLHMFPRIQIHLRRDILSEHSRLEADLYQWYHGSKFCSGTMECLITLGQSEQTVEVKCRGPSELRTSLYYFQEDLVDIVLDVIEDSCPGICLEKYVLSARQLATHGPSVFAYTPKDILSAQLEGRTSITLDDKSKEEFIDLIGFGSEEIWNNITPGIDLHSHYLSIHARRRVSMLLDPPDPMGRDWCLLAVSLGLTEDLPKVDQGENQIVRSKTDSIIDMWSRDTSSTIAALIRRLAELGRQDAADALLTVSPLYHVFQESSDDKNAQQPLSCSSENTLSSSNLSR